MISNNIIKEILKGTESIDEIKADKWINDLINLNITRSNKVD